MLNQVRYGKFKRGTSGALCLALPELFPGSVALREKEYFYSSLDEHHILCYPFTHLGGDRLCERIQDNDLGLMSCLNHGFP